MSIASRFAWLRAVTSAQRRPTLAEMMVAVSLAEHHNDARGIAWPSSRYLADTLLIHRATVRKALSGLEERGFIRRVETGNRSLSFTLEIPSMGATQRHRWAPDSAHDGRQPAPDMGALQRPEQVFRNEHVGIPYYGANARVASAPRAGAEHRRKRSKPSIPATL